MPICGESLDRHKGYRNDLPTSPYVMIFFLQIWCQFSTGHSFVDHVALLLVVALKVQPDGLDNIFRFDSAICQIHAIFGFMSRIGSPK
jgi:hypothetical protein